MTQNLWNAAKAVLRGKFIAIQSHLKKQEQSQINNLTVHLKQLEKEEQRKPKVSRRKEISLFILQEMRDRVGGRTLGVWPSDHNYFIKAISIGVKHKFNKSPS